MPMPRVWNSINGRPVFPNWPNSCSNTASYWCRHSLSTERNSNRSSGVSGKRFLNSRAKSTSFHDPLPGKISVLIGSMLRLRQLLQTARLHGSNQKPSEHDNETTSPLPTQLKLTGIDEGVPAPFQELAPLRWRRSQF